MAKHTLKILRCEYLKIFKVCLAIFQHYEKRLTCVRRILFSMGDNLRETPTLAIKVCIFVYLALIELSF